LKLIEVNIEALIETISFEDDNLGKSFLDTVTGEVLYIPTEVSTSLENGTLKDDTFDNWLKEFARIAMLISEDEVNRYLSTPHIDEEFYIKSMKKYADTISDNTDLKLELINALKNEEPIKKFKHILMDRENAADEGGSDSCATSEWYKYEDLCIDEFIRAWLKSNDIEIKYLN